jgi:hypothetical protein
VTPVGREDPAAEPEPAMQDDAPAPMPGGGPLARPGMQQLMEQFGDAPNFEELIDNPAFRVLMQQFMQDPELLDELRQQAEEDEEERDSDEESDSEDEHDDGMIEFGDEDEDEEGLEDETPPQGDRDEVIRQMAADADMSRMEREVSMSRSGAGLFEDSFASSAGGAGGAGSAVDLDDLFMPTPSAPTRRRAWTRWSRCCSRTCSAAASRHRCEKTSRGS